MVTMKAKNMMAMGGAGQIAPDLVQASMSQVEMTVWLGVMGLMTTGMMALLALAGK